MPSLAASLGQLTRQVQGLSDAWAVNASAPPIGCFAAVMGSSLERHMSLDSDWQPDTEDASTRGIDEVTGFLVSQEGNDEAVELGNELNQHVRGVVDHALKSAWESIANDMARSLRKATGRSEYRGVVPPKWQSKARAFNRWLTQELAEALELTMSVRRAEAGSMTSGRFAAENRTRVIEKWHTQTAHIHSVAQNFQDLDQLLRDSKEERQSMRNAFARENPGASHQWYSSKDAKKLDAQVQGIERERSGLEVELQSYFDHHLQGSVRNEHSRPDRSKFSYVANLVDGKVGRKQIQIMDSYLQTRGNEYWAIYPDIIRIGHDQDPKKAIHWMPSTCIEDYPEAIRPYRLAQSDALAGKLLAEGVHLRTSLLSAGKFGKDRKISYKASIHDGPALYSVLLNRFHPIGRDQFSKMENQLVSFGAKFRTGDPRVTLLDFQTILLDANESGNPLKFDQIMVPVIDHLSTRVPEVFGVKLAEDRCLGDNPDDAGIEMFELCGKIEGLIDECDQRKVNWNEGTAKAASSSLQSDISKLRARLAQLEGSAKLSYGNTLKDGKAGLKGNPTGKCMAKGCGQRIEKFKAGCGWKLCGTCLMKVRTTEKSLALTDGSTWEHRPFPTAKAAADSQIGAMRKAGSNACSKAAVRKMAKAVTVVEGGDGEETRQARKARVRKDKKLAKRDAKRARASGDSDDEGEALAAKRVRFTDQVDDLVGSTDQIMAGLLDGSRFGKKSKGKRKGSKKSSK